MKKRSSSTPANPTKADPMVRPAPAPLPTSALAGESQSVKNLGPWDSAILIGIISIWGYIWAYGYASGYAEY
jgi:hypothetical protein